MRDRSLGSTIRVYFSTHDSTGACVAPSSAFAASDFKIYKDGSATEKTTTNGITVTSPFDSLTGGHLIEIDTSNATGDSGFWASGAAYRVVLSTAKTVDSVSVSGMMVGEFSIELQTADVRKVGGTAQTAGDIAALINTLDDYVDTEVAAIKAKTDNLPSDPADASDIASSFSTVNSTLATISAYIDTEIAAIKAKTDNLPTDPADASDIASAFSTVNSTLATIAAYIDTEVAAIKAKTDNLPTDPADASDIAASFSSLASTLSTIASYIDTEVAAIKAKTDNLPTDPADQSLIEAAITAATSSLATAAALSAIDTKIDTIDDLIDTEVAAIKAKTDNLPTDPADQSAVEAAITTAQTAITTAMAALATATELAKVPKAGETRRYTQIAANAGSKTADVSIGNPL